MTAAPHSPLVWRVAEAIKSKALLWMEYGDPVIDNPQEVAQAALAACHAEEMREVLELLVNAKDMKVRSGDTPAYRAKKEEGWSRAKAVLAKLERGE